MIAYPYQGRDLFAELETYFYAPCGDPDFLAAWKASRDEAITRLRGVTNRDSCRAVPSGSDANHGVALYDLLQDVKARLIAGSLDHRTAAAKIEPFVKKYEVFKRLFSRYDSDLRRAAESAPASVESYVAFAECLCLLAQADDRLRFISTLLKVCDALCTVSVDGFTRDGAARLIHVLTQERQLVELLES